MAVIPVVNEERDPAIPTAQIRCKDFKLYRLYILKKKTNYLQN